MEVTKGEERVFTGTQLPKIDDMADYARSIAGNYYSEELGVYYDINVSNGKPVLYNDKLPEVTLTGDYQDSLVSESGRLIVVIDRNDYGSVCGFRLTTGRVIDLIFTKKNALNTQCVN